MFYGSTSGQNAVWDASDKSLEFADAASATFGTGGDMKIWHNSNVNRIDLTSPLYIYDASNYVSIGEHASNNTLEMKLVGAADHDAALYFGDANDAVEAGIWWDTSEARLHFQGYNNTTRMTIGSTGNVGIGTNNPTTHKLQIEGSNNGVLDLLKLANTNTGSSAYAEMDIYSSTANLRIGITDPSYSGFTGAAFIRNQTDGQIRIVKIFCLIGLNMELPIFTHVATTIAMVHLSLIHI